MKISASFKSGFVLPLLVVGVTGHAPMAMAQSPGTFTPTGSMTTARLLHTATLLLDGRVLIAGGFATPPGPPLASAELYNPSAGTFTATGSMTTARSRHSATLLPDGRVLIAGGNSGTSAELYDPSTGIFTATDRMAASHNLATLLNTGKVLMTGPWTGSNAELYDPATGAFTAASAYAGANPAPLFMATLLADGRVLISGCTTDDSGECAYSVDVAQLYDPATGTFSVTGGCCYLEGTTTLLTNGKVLFAGGGIDVSWYSVAVLYDSSTGNFTRTGDMTKARVDHTATLLPDSKVLITGGAIETYPLMGTIQSAELYDPSTGTFTAAGNMTSRRAFHTSTLLKDGRVLIAGGISTLGGSISTLPLTLSSVELHTPPVLAPAPLLFSLSGDGRGQGAIWHAETGQIASSQNRAVAGEVLSMYTSSLGDGSVIPPQVAIGGWFGEILFFGGAPGYPGFNQVNVRVPSGVAPGSAVPVRLIYLGRSSNEVTIGMQ
jgi:Galactose oxidase, central domain